MLRADNKNERITKRKNNMMRIDATTPRHRLIMGLIATLAALGLLFVTTYGEPKSTAI